MLSNLIPHVQNPEVEAAIAAANGGFLQMFLAAGFVGPLLLLLGAVAIVTAVQRWRDLELAAMAPVPLQRALEAAVRSGPLEDAFAQASASRTPLGDLVAAGLLLRHASLDEMLANTERAAIKESLDRQASIVALSRLGTTILLLALFGTVTGLMRTMAVLSGIQSPPVSLFTIGIGESLASTAIGLLLALVSYWLYGLLSARVVQRLLQVREIAEELLAEAVRTR